MPQYLLPHLKNSGSESDSEESFEQEPDRHGDNEKRPDPMDLVSTEKEILSGVVNFYRTHAIVVRKGISGRVKKGVCKSFAT